MNYIVLDLEWNQAEGKSHKRLAFEIIEIGAIKLDSEKRVIGKFNELIKPKVYSYINRVTRSLIHIKMEELQKGISFVEAMNKFLKWCGDDYIFCTWGSLDLLELQRNMKYYKMKPLSQGPIAFLDVQKLFSRQYEDKVSRRTLEYAVDFLHIEKDIPFHRAYSDAYYTVKVLNKISKETEKHISFDVFNTPKNKKHEIQVVFDDYTKYITREFSSKLSIMNDKEIVSTRCYKCGKNLPKIQKWFTPNGKHYYCICKCPIHGYMKGKIRVRKTEKDNVYAIKTLKLISQQEMEEILLKKERASIKRKRKRNN
ncbi:MAG: exonuclease domain-containing protein [Lachnospiraceae bacterium]|nr:exonuclease domain-containing protein [Lachnospiraceae bacterium]